MAITNDDILLVRRRRQREIKIEPIQKRWAIKGSWTRISWIVSQPDPARTADQCRALLKAMRGRRFDDNKGRSQVRFLSSDPRAPMRVTPEFVENMVAIYGDEIDDVDPYGERRPENSPIVRSFLAKCWIRKEAYQKWATGTCEAAAEPLTWGFGDPKGRFKWDDEVPVPEWLLKAKDGLRGTDRKAWPQVVKMIELINMDRATRPSEAARFIQYWDPEQQQLGHTEDAIFTRLRKLCTYLLKKRETESA